MNRKMIFSTLGKLTVSEAVLMIFPLIVALIYREAQSAIAFLIAIGIAATVGFSLYFGCKTKNNHPRVVVFSYCPCSINRNLAAIFVFKMRTDVRGNCLLFWGIVV